jgi:DMSO/TMAO reductase YedYZ molybdopterin-dependent catalytic subunit
MASRRTRTFYLGMAAGALALALSFVLRLFAGGSFLPELASQAFFSLVPAQVESGAVVTLGSFAKYTTYTVSIFVTLVIYGLVSLLFLRLGEAFSARSSTKALSMAGVSFAVILTLSGLFLSVTRINSQPVSATLLLLNLVFPQLLFGFSLTFFENRYLPISTEIVSEMPRQVDSRRRWIIASGATLAAVAVLALYGLGFLQKGEARSSDLSTFFANDVTSNVNFYRVDIDILPPSVRSSSWSLKVDGMVDSQLTLSYDDVQAMPAVEQYNTLECVSNAVGGDLMSTAQWRGVKLKDLLSKAGIQDGATYVVFKCTDQYDVGIPLSKGMEDGTILAYEMNGSPLPQEHGYPLRAIVPGYYGMMNPKWITEITLVDQTYQGFWQQSGWANEAQYQTGSTIVSLGNDALADRFGIYSPTKVAFGSPVTIAGVAFAGDRGISKVEVSTDKANTWSTATLVAPLSINSWVLWSLEWNPPASGSYDVVVRAIDGDGNLQTETVADPFPSGATGWHYVTVDVT